MPYIKHHGPDAPTRLATGDSLKTRIFYVRDSKCFIIADTRAEPTFYDVVITDQLDDDTLVIEPYEGQSYIGVVRVLAYYQLPKSERWLPGVCGFLIGLISSVSGLLVV